MKDIITKFAASNNTKNSIGIHIDNISESQDNLTTNIKDIINAVVGVLALVCVVVIIIGGVSYMVSGGDSGKVKKAKDTILYGVIGLVICALAFAIVNWVLASVLGQ